MNLNLEPRPIPTTDLRLHPLLSTDRIEVLDNVREVRGRQELSLEGHYKGRRRLFLNPTSGGRVIVDGVIGRSAVAKGSFVMDEGWVALQDSVLHQGLDKQDKRFNLVSVNFSMCAMAAALEGIVPPLRHGQWTSEHYVDISDFIWNKTRENVLDNTAQDEVTWLLFESAAATSYPVSADIPVRVEGLADKGNSALYNLARHPKTRDHIDIFAMHTDRDVIQEAATHRNLFDPNASDFSPIFGGDIEYVLTNDNRELVDASTLPYEQQRKIVAILSVATAGPIGVFRSDREVNEVRARLFQDGKIKSEDDRAYFEFIRKGLDLPSKQFHHLANRRFFGPKTYHLDYLLKYNLMMRLYPELPDFIVQNYA